MIATTSLNCPPECIVVNNSELSWTHQSLSSMCTIKMVSEVPKGFVVAVILKQNAE